MKELEIKIPTSWDEVTLRMFDEISAADGNPIDKTVTILQTLTGIDRKTLNGLPATFLETSGVMEGLSFLQHEPKKRVPAEKLTLNNKRYTVGLYPQKWTAAQYLDYTTVLQQGDNKKLARIVACFCVPEGKKYGEGYDFEQLVDELYDNMSITLALGYSGFFHLLLTSFEKALSAYTERKKRKSTRRQGNRSKRK